MFTLVYATQCTKGNKKDNLIEKVFFCPTGANIRVIEKAFFFDLLVCFAAEKCF